MGKWHMGREIEERAENPPPQCNYFAAAGTASVFTAAMRAQRRITHMWEQPQGSNPAFLIMGLTQVHHFSILAICQHNSCCNVGKGTLPDYGRNYFFQVSEKGLYVMQQGTVFVCSSLSASFLPKKRGGIFIFGMKINQGRDAKTVLSPDSLPHSCPLAWFPLPPAVKARLSGRNKTGLSRIMRLLFFPFSFCHFFLSVERSRHSAQALHSECPRFEHRHFQVTDLRLYRSWERTFSV